jgi:hypothetical protein
LTKQMHLPEVERPANLLDLGDKSRDLPERQVVRFVGAPGSELIVAGNAKAFGGKIEKWCQVFGVATRTTVEQQESPVTRARAFIPDAADFDVNMSLFTHIHTLPTFPHVTAGPVSARNPLNPAAGYASAGTRFRPNESQYQSGDKV